MNDKEEMIIVEDNPDLIVINQLPIISERLDKVKDEIKRRTAFRYRNSIGGKQTGNQKNTCGYECRKVKT